MTSELLMTSVSKFRVLPVLLTLNPGLKFEKGEKVVVRQIFISNWKPAMYTLQMLTEVLPYRNSSLGEESHPQNNLSS